MEEAGSAEEMQRDGVRTARGESAMLYVPIQVQCNSMISPDLPIGLGWRDSPFRKKGWLFFQGCQQHNPSDFCAIQLHTDGKELRMTKAVKVGRVWSRVSPCQASGPTLAIALTN